MTEAEITELYHTDRQKFFKLIGAKGGRAKHPKKGFGGMTLAKRREAARKGGQAKAL